MLGNRETFLVSPPEVDLKLSDLRRMERHEPERLARYLDLCGDRLNFMHLEFGFDFSSFRRGVPRSKRELFEQCFEFQKADPKLVDRIMERLSEYISVGLTREEEVAQDPKNWRFEDFTLEKRLGLETLHRYGAFEQLEQGLIARQTLFEFMRSFEPTRDDYLRSRVIFPTEYEQVAERFGPAVLLGSLRSTSAYGRRIRRDVGKVKTFLFSLDPETRIFPDAVRAVDPKMYRLALKTFKLLQWAVKDLCHQSFYPRDNAIYTAGFQIMLDEGRDAAVAHFRKFRFPPDMAKRIVAQFAAKQDRFTGAASRISTSAFEREIQRQFDQEGIFYRRQVPYSAVVETKRRFVMDFLVGDTIIEVVDQDDPVIHTDEYWDRVTAKHNLADKAGKNFLLLSPDEPYEAQVSALIKEAFIPDELYRLADRPAEPKSTSIVQPAMLEGRKGQPFSNRIFYYCSNPFMIGYLKQRAAMLRSA